MKKIFIQCALLLMMVVPNAYSAQISGITFKDVYKNNDTVLNLQGTGLKTVLFLRAFVAGYYTTKQTTTDDLGEFPKRIEVEYFVNIPGQKLNAYTVERMKLNVNKETMATLQEQIKSMEQYFVDLKPGDRFALTYIPGAGTKFEHNQRLVGTVEGSVFAKALFSVWIGEKPFDPQLKQQIIGAPKTQEFAKNNITPGFVSNIVEFGPAQAKLLASIRYSVLGKYTAHFTAFKGSIAIDEGSKFMHTVYLEIDAASIQSDCSWCDNIVRSPLLLNTGNYPKIVFKGQGTSKDSRNYFVRGTIEMHGFVRDVVFPFQFEMTQDPKTMQRKLNIQGKGMINRKDYGIIWNKLLDHGGILAGDKITVEWDVKKTVDE